MLSIYVDVTSGCLQVEGMLEALTHFEFKCVFEELESTTADEVRAFLSEKYGQEMSEEFQESFMVSPIDCALSGARDPR